MALCVLLYFVNPGISLSGQITRMMKLRATLGNITFFQTLHKHEVKGGDVSWDSDHYCVLPGLNVQLETENPNLREDGGGIVPSLISEASQTEALHLRFTYSFLYRYLWE